MGATRDGRYRAGRDNLPCPFFGAHDDARHCAIRLGHFDRFVQLITLKHGTQVVGVSIRDDHISGCQSRQHQRTDSGPSALDVRLPSASGAGTMPRFPSWSCGISWRRRPISSPVDAATTVREQPAPATVSEVNHRTLGGLDAHVRQTSGAPKVGVMQDRSRARMQARSISRGFARRRKAVRAAAASGTRCRRRQRSQLSVHAPRSPWGRLRHASPDPHLCQGLMPAQALVVFTGPEDLGAITMITCSGQEYGSGFGFSGFHEDRTVFRRDQFIWMASDSLVSALVFSAVHGVFQGISSGAGWYRPTAPDQRHVFH